jgi:all-trans-8'-apo-beta-carotenal 15,15'-oxygenase
MNGIHSRNDKKENSSVKISRRQFGFLIGGLSALALVDTHAAVRVLAEDKRLLSRLAYRAANAEGAWKLTKIEGELPKDLVGTLYRTAPGQKDNHGHPLKHFFDGDAYISGFSFRDGRASLRAKFVETPKRLEELKAGRMLYAEFGTAPPSPPPEGEQPRRGGKNQPNVNVIYYNNRLLGLSEGGHPTALDPATLTYQGKYSYQDTLPQNVPFTAHPKFDPGTGEGYGFGIERGPSMALNVYRMEQEGTLTKLYAVPQPAYYMVHDMMISKNHIVFIIPPVFYDVASLMTGKVLLADALRYAERAATTVLILRRDGKGQPVKVELPASMVFHHGNAFEREGKLVFDSVIFPDGSILEEIYAWSKEKPVSNMLPPSLTRFVIDLVNGKLESRAELETDQEFPRFDERKTGTDARYLYSVEAKNPADPFLFNKLVQHDLHKGTAKRIIAGKGRAIGEPVFVPRPGKETEENGWLLILGYDGNRDENFLEIRDAATLDFASRVWTGIHFPLGFHGNFTTKSFVSI